MDPAIIAELTARIPDFARAYDPDGLAPGEFDGYGATVRTLRAFIGSYHDLLGTVRDIVLPDSDKRPAYALPDRERRAGTLSEHEIGVCGCWLMGSRIGCLAARPAGA